MAAGPTHDSALSAAPAGGLALARMKAGRRRGVRDELTLVRAAQDGSREALEELFRRHWPACHRAAYLVVHDHAAAEDIAQEAFLRAVRSLDGFDHPRPLGPWLHRIVVNRAIDWARARATRAEVGGPLEDREAPAHGDWTPDGLAALAILSPEQRAVVVLRHVLGYTPGEIAVALELPRGTVNSRLRRALDALTVAFDEEPRR